MNAIAARSPRCTQEDVHPDRWTLSGCRKSDLDKLTPTYPLGFHLGSKPSAWAALTTAANP